MMGRRRFHEALLTLALSPRNLAKSLSQGMPGTPSQGLMVVALDGQWLRLVQVEGPATNRRLTKVAAASIGSAGADEIGKTFQGLCATERVTPMEVLVATPTHLCTARLFSLPSTDPKEIRDIVELQAEKHTPYAKEEVLMDFKVVDRDRSGYSRVLLVIAHQDVIHRSVRLVEASGFTLDRVGCELEGLVSWFHLVKKGPAGAASSASLIVDVDAGATTVIMMQRGQPQFHRSLAMGSEQLQADPAATGERLVSELQRSLEAIETDGGTPKIGEVLLTGRVERLGELKGRLEHGLDVPVSLVAPWGAREVSEGIHAAWERLPDVSMSGLVGLALAPSHIDLTPQSTKLRQAFEARAKSLVLLGCQCVGVLVLISLLVVGRAQKEQRYYHTLRGLYEQGAAGALDVEEALRDVGFVKERLRQRGKLLEAVDILAKLSPPGVRWESVAFAAGESTVLKGTSKELPKIYEFVANLDKQPIFRHVEAKRVSKRKGDESDLTDFEISCPLVGAKAAR